MSTTKPVEEGFHTITPYLVIGGAAEAIEFYKKAFGAEEVMRLPMPDGKLGHAMIRIGDSNVMLSDESPEWGTLGPLTLKGTPVKLHISVPDVDQAFQRAVDAGAIVKMPVADMFWGDRYGVVEDPFGHSWSLATHVRDVSVEEMQKALQQQNSCT